jgi:hypothetical protein
MPLVSPMQTLTCLYKQWPNTPPDFFQVPTSVLFFLLALQNTVQMGVKYYSTHNYGRFLLWKPM